jgi:integrase
MTDLTFMRLRHTAVTRLGEVGCNTGQISAITGHSQSTVQQLMNRYMVSTGEMARQAFQKRLDGEKQA